MGFRNIIWLWILLTGCGGSQKSLNQSVLPHSTDASPDYFDLQFWAAHPAKYDASDSLPAPWRFGYNKDNSVDVFFIHPTSYLSEKAVDKNRLPDAAEARRWNASLYDSALNVATDASSILNQASVFNQYRVFAPRYRQAHIRAFYKDSVLAAPFFDKAYGDVASAFDWYLKNENQGRPFIIAAHSQGTLHAGRLLREKIEGTPLQKKLIAAYLIGMPVPVHYFRQIPVCDSPSATGCVISWRTFRRGYVPEKIAAEPFEAIVVNPLTFSRQPGYVSREMNKGAVLWKYNKPKEKNVGAEIHRNVLWSTKPRFFGNWFFTRKNYHIGDINLFWMNVRENAADRVAAYRKQQAYK